MSIPARLHKDFTRKARNVVVRQGEKMRRVGVICPREDGEMIFVVPAPIEMTDDSPIPVNHYALLVLFERGVKHVYVADKARECTFYATTQEIVSNGALSLRKAFGADIVLKQVFWFVTDYLLDLPPIHASARDIVLRVEDEEKKHKKKRKAPLPPGIDQPSLFDLSIEPREKHAESLGLFDPETRH